MKYHGWLNWIQMGNCGYLKSMIGKTAVCQGIAARRINGSTVGQHTLYIDNSAVFQ
jgi:hypothetical protein